MKKIVITLVLLAALLSSCNLANDLWGYYNKTKDFTNSLNHKDYERCITMLDMDLMQENNIAKDTLIAQMKMINGIIDDYFGAVTYSSPYVQMNSSWTSTHGSSKTYPHASINFDNGKYVGEFDITFDNKSKKIRGFKLIEMKEPIPNLTLFWVFMVLGIFNAAFIIYVITLVKHSDSKRKKRKYALAILLSLPTLSYNSFSGISFHLLNVQLFLGSGFSKTGYFSTVWDLAFPLGALIVIYRLRKEKRIAEDELAQEMLAKKWAEENIKVPEESLPTTDANSSELL